MWNDPLEYTFAQFRSHLNILIRQSKVEQSKTHAHVNV